MSRKTETLRLQEIALKSGGYIAKPCPKCSWWQQVGNKDKFEQDYCPDIRCKCRKEAR